MDTEEWNEIALAIHVFGDTRVDFTKIPHDFWWFARMLYFLDPTTDPWKERHQFCVYTRKDGKFLGRKDSDGDLGWLTKDGVELLKKLGGLDAIIISQES